MNKMLLGAVGFIAIYNIFFYQTDAGIGTGLFFLALNCYFFFIKNPESNNTSFGIASSAISTSFAFLFAFRANGIVQFFDILAALFFALTALYLYKQTQKVLPRLLSFFLSPFTVLLAAIVAPFTHTWSTNPVNKDLTPSIVRGTLIAFPVIIVLFLLLVIADPVFAKLAGDFLGNLGERTIISLILFVCLVMFGIAKIVDKIVEHVQPKILANGKAHELSIITGSIIALFACFILVQFKYLFSHVNEKDLAQLGIASLTYSEYVRKGFFELIVASLIASSVVMYVLRYLHDLKDRQKMLVQFFAAMLTIETGLLLLSAVMRVWQYAHMHGLTRARIFGFIFLVWLAIILIIFLIRVIKELKKEQLFAATMLTTLGAFLLINIINVDGIIATAYKPTVNKEIDYYYIASLSPDAYEGWRPVINDAEKTIAHLETVTTLSPDDNRKLYWRKNTLDRLETKIGNLINKYGTIEEILAWNQNNTTDWVVKLKKTKSEDTVPQGLQDSRKWQSWNGSEYAAYKAVSNDMDYFKKIFSLQDKITEIEKRVSEQVQQSTPIDRSTQAPLTQ